MDSVAQLPSALVRSQLVQLGALDQRERLEGLEALEVLDRSREARLEHSAC